MTAVVASPEVSEVVVADRPVPAVAGGSGPEATDEAGEPTWPDASAEAVFLAEARGRGEIVPPRPAATEPVEESDMKTLPALNDLVNRIPPEVREALDDLFRARFITVKRIPQRALKP